MTPSPPDSLPSEGLGNRRLELLEGVFSCAADAIFITDFSGRFVDVNPAACQLVGYSREELLQLYPWDLILSAPKETILSDVRNMHDGQTPLEVRRECRTKAGEKFVADLRLNWCRIGDEERIVVICRNVTHLCEATSMLIEAYDHMKKTEATLLENRGALQIAIDTIPGLVWSAEPDGYIDTLNKRWLDYTGMEHDLAKGWGWRAAIHPEDVDALADYWKSVVTEQKPGETEARLRSKTGDYRWFLFRAVPLFASDGLLIKWYGTTTDIDERKRMEDGHRRNEDYLRLVTDTIPGLIWSAHATGEIEYLNKAWLQYSGRTMEQAGGWGWQATIHPDDLPSMLEIWRGMIREQRAGEVEARMRRHDGVYRWFLFRGVPLFNADGKLFRWHGTSTDIEDKKLAAETLRASEKFARGQAEALNRTLDALTREPDPRRLTGHVLRIITEQFEAFSCSLWRRMEDSGLVRFEYAFEHETVLTREDPVLGPISPDLTIDQVWPWPEIFRTGRPVVLENIAEGPDFPWRKHLLAKGVVTILTVPMSIAGAVEGVLGIRFLAQKKFRAEEIELAQALANQAMLAMQLAKVSMQSRQAGIASERMRMARDIHDTLAQGFTGVIVQLEAAADAFSRDMANEAKGHFQKAGDLARESLREARHSVHALRLPALEEQSLVDALRSMAEKLTEGSPVKLAFHCSGVLPLLPREWEENMLRIGQEVLANALRHAQATAFDVVIEVHPAEIDFAFRDNGRGFNPSGRYDRYGLIGIGERVGQMSGQITINSAHGRGTEVLIRLPWRPIK